MPATPRTHKQRAERWSSKGRLSGGKGGSCPPLSPLLVTVGPGDLGLDPTWVISAECEKGAGGWQCDHPLPPWGPRVLRVQGAEHHAPQHGSALSLAPLPEASSLARTGLKP